MQMNVLFDHQAFYHQKFGGISRYFYELARGINLRDDFSASVVAPLHGNEYLQSGKFKFIKGLCPKRQLLGTGRVRDLGRKLLLPIYYALNCNSDIVHETYYTMTPSGRGQYRILTVFDMIHELFPAQFRDDLITVKAKKTAVLRADHVICISESTRQDLVRLLGVDQSKTSVVHLGHSFINSSFNSQILIRRTGRPYLLYVGNRDRYKNFHALCRAFAASNFLRKKFDIVAFGGADFSVIEKEYLVDFGIIDYVRHVIGGDELLEMHYREASLFVFPSLYEGFGIPPLEAMNCNCPVVCSNAGSIPEVVGDAGVYFDPYSVDSIRDAIERVVTSTILQSELLVKGRERIKMFSWDKCVKDTAAIYKSVVDGNL